MAVYYKFKSAKDFDSIAIDGHFISVATLKERIFESKHLGRGTDFDLVVTNAQTNEEYPDEAMLIPKNTSVLVRRIPGRPRMSIVSHQDEPKLESKPADDQLVKSNFTAADSSVFKDLETSEWDDEFGNDLYATIPEVTPVQSSNLVQDAPPPSKADEESKIRALIETPALDWQSQACNGFGPGRGYGRGGRAMGGRGFGRGGGLGKTPPQGYVCHRCKQPGHFIQHCPTNGDPNFDIKKIKQPTGIPRSMLMATPNGSYALPSGDVAVLRPNEAAFEKEIEGLPSTRSVGDLPPELHCPLCKEVMKDAVLTSKCCFKSFCDKCIRDYIMSKSMCICGAVHILADDLLPNKTLRDTINRILESNNNSSADNAGSALHIQDMESARCPPPKNPSPTQSAASKGEQMHPPRAEETPKPMEAQAEQQPDPPQHLQAQTSEKKQSAKIPDISEATHESASAREPASLGSAVPVEEEVQQKLGATETAKSKKKKKKARLPGATDMQWRANQEFPMDNFMTPMGPSAYNPYWGGMQPGMDGFMGPYGGGMPYNMGFGVGPMDMPFGGVMPPQDPFGAPQGFMLPPLVPPQRDLADMSMGPMGMNPGMSMGMNMGMNAGMNMGMNPGMNPGMNMGMNVRPPLMSREEFEARKADLRRKREMERRVERDMPKDRDYGREASSNADIPSMKPKPKPVPRSPSVDRYDDYERDRIRERERRDDNHHRNSSYRSERISPERPTRDHEPPLPSSKRKSEHHRRYEDDYDYDQEREHERERRHQHQHHRPESSSAKPATISTEPSPAPPASTKPTSSASSASAAAVAAAERKKASVFSRISFPEGEPSKKRKSSSSSMEVKPSSTKSHDAGGSGHHHQSHKTASSSTVANGYHKSSNSAMDYESSDDDRHFKRKPARYDPSPPPPVVVEEQMSSRHSKGSKERERDRGGHRKHR